MNVSWCSVEVEGAVWGRLDAMLPSVIPGAAVTTHVAHHQQSKLIMCSRQTAFECLLYKSKLSLWYRTDFKVNILINYHKFVREKDIIFHCTCCLQFEFPVKKVILLKVFSTNFVVCSQRQSGPTFRRPSQLRNWEYFLVASPADAKYPLNQLVRTREQDAFEGLHIIMKWSRPCCSVVWCNRT